VRVSAHHVTDKCATPSLAGVDLNPCTPPSENIPAPTSPRPKSRRDLLEAELQPAEHRIDRTMVPMLGDQVIARNRHATERGVQCGSDPIAPGGPRHSRPREGKQSRSYGGACVGQRVVLTG
jgi:hypothetical protein